MGERLAPRSAGGQLLRARLAGSGALALLLAACADSPTTVGSTLLLSVMPAAEAVNVAVDAPIEVRFDGPIAAGSGLPVALQLGDCPGPVVAGTWSRSPDGTVLSFTPAAPLDPATRYTIHVGGALRDADGAIVNLESRGPGLGGMWVTREMVMGMMSMGMGMVSHSGPEWLHPNGFFGLAFAFTTVP